MAIIIIFLILCRTFTVSNAESSSERPVSSRKVRISREWIKIWPESENTYLLGISGGPEESVYLALNNLDFSDGSSQINITYFGGDGSIYWEKEVSVSKPWRRSGSRSQSASSNMTGALYLVGSIGNNWSDEAGVVVRIEPNGSLSWESGWGGDERGYFQAVAIVNTDDVIAAGGTLNSDDSRSGLLVQFSPTGEQLWNYTWNGTDSAYKTEFHSVAIGPTDEIYAAGTIRGPAIIAREALLVAKFDQMGQIRWNITSGIQCTGSSCSVSILDCVARPSGGVLILGYRMDGQGPKIFSLALNDDGSQDELQIWDTEESTGTNLWLTALASFEEENYLAVGSKTETIYEPPFEYNGSLYMVVLDQNGKSISNETWSQPQDLFGEGIVQGESHSYYITGHIGNWLYRTEDWFMARLHIELIDLLGNRDFLIPIIVSSLIVASIIALTLGGLGLFARMHRRKKKTDPNEIY
ncbi:MAG: hypothetical protein ACE5OZ_20535 [Candidatus Heimdallarchaeota archaeon]